ncbi:MAG: tetratricopeptide repeat protein [Candidatus Marinimicrobia bacterium]|nr:tetratricopeptide repeat protein [Candidatus Neomarinimicrobiota bacterium]
MYEKALGPDHPDVTTVLENMVDLYKNMGMEEEAIRLEKRVNAIRSNNE